MNKKISLVTQKVIKDLDKLTDKDFFYRYQITKSNYIKRLIKYKDPYMNSPLAKIGKFLEMIYKNISGR